MVLKLLDRMLAGEGGTARALTPAEMTAVAKSVDLGAVQLDGCCQFNPERYVRNTIHLNDHFELVVICWMPGQESSIHDHGVSQCLYLIVEGEMVEERFRRVEGAMPEPTDERRFGPGDITIAAGEDVHRIANRADSNLVTIHIYSPPLDDAVTLFTPTPRYLDAQ
ncbi:MAG: cysteine dioxygenase family protein [Planctomycetota bacterium]|nr:cysteine dioxygenase family protein [Planctomycetota bacterium]